MYIHELPTIHDTGYPWAVSQHQLAGCDVTTNHAGRIHQLHTFLIQYPLSMLKNACMHVVFSLWNYIPVQPWLLQWRWRNHIQWHCTYTFRRENSVISVIIVVIVACRHGTSCRNDWHSTKLHWLCVQQHWAVIVLSDYMYPVYNIQVS